MLRVPVRVHLVSGLEFVDNGKTIDTWVTAESFTQSVLPEINRIWEVARIQWEVESVVVEAAAQGPVLQSALQRIAKRETVEIPTFRRLFDESRRHPELVNLYLVPSIGSANGVAGKGVRIAIVGVWRKHGSAGLQRAPLVMSVPPLPSVAKTCSHELGHILGLVHPQERQLERLMQAGPGLELTAEEIVTARLRAAELGK